MVNENDINTILDQLESESHLYSSKLEKMMTDLPIVTSFLTQESTSVLTENEKDILWFMALVITSLMNFDNDKLSENHFSDKEDKNWEILNSQKGEFRTRITPFFNKTDQEDLLAFVEDTLEDDEDSPITPIGKEVIFIMSKTLIDLGKE